MDLDKIRDLGKKEISWDKLKAMCNESEANDRLWFWMEGFRKAQEILNGNN